MARRDLNFKSFLLHHAQDIIANELHLQVDAWEPAETEPSVLETYAQRLYTGTIGEDREAAGVLFFTFVEERFGKFKRWPEIRAQVLQTLRKVGFGMDVLDDMILNTDIAQHAVEEAERRGQTQGLAKGKAQGLAEGKTQGLAEGKTQGLAEGKTQGLAEGKIQILRLLWLKKFGALNEDVEAAMSTAALEVLDHVVAQMLEPTYTLDQARADLGV